MCSSIVLGCTAAWFFGKFNGTSPIKLQKTCFSILRQKMWFIHPWGSDCIQLIVESQSSDNRNRFAVITLRYYTGNKSPITNSDDFVAVCQFLLPVNRRRFIGAKNQRIRFQQELWENFQPWYEWAFHYQLFVVGAPQIWKSHISLS